MVQLPLHLKCNKKKLANKKTIYRFERCEKTFQADEKERPKQWTKNDIFRSPDLRNKRNIEMRRSPVRETERGIQNGRISIS